MSEIKKIQLTNEGEIIIHEKDGFIHTLKLNDETEQIEFETIFTKQEVEKEDGKQTKTENDKKEDRKRHIFGIGNTKQKGKQSN